MINQIFTRTSFVKKVILFAVILAGFFALFFPLFQTPVFAAEVDICGLHPRGCVSDLDGSGNVNNVVTWIINLAKILIIIITALTVLYIILGAWFIITGIGGDGPTYEKGLKIIKSAVVGFIIAVLSFTIVTLIDQALDGNGILADIFK